MIVDSRKIQVYRSPALEKDSAGIGNPDWSGEGRKQHASGYFFACASSNGRPGGRAARPPVLHRHFRLPFRSPTQSEIGLAVHNRNWSITMKSIIVLPTASPVPVINRRIRGGYPRGVVSLVRYRRKLLSERLIREERAQKITEARNHAAAWLQLAESIQIKGATA